MRKKYIILTLIFLTTGFWFLRNSISVKKNEGYPHPSNGGALDLPVVPFLAGSQIKKQTLQKRESFIFPHLKSLSDSPYSQKPKGNIVDFIVVNGMAISFGDIILGKVEPGIGGNHGSFDAPAPHTWDKLEIPYIISSDLINPGRVEKALDYLRQHTGIRFIPYTNETDAISFEPGPEHCYSLLGRVGGIQPIQLAEGCQSQEILHEIMHALGFIHQQSRQDRDQFIEVLWQNIEKKFWSQYSIVPESFMEGERGFVFDYASIMLYRPSAFAVRSDVLTMKSKGEDTIRPSQDGMSEGDIRRINRLFKLE
jgi:hypothetical protein